MQWSVDICRICGEINKFNHLIFTDPPNDLASKLKNCLNLKVFQDDNKPKQVCNTCVMKVNDFCEFLTICYKNDRKFESIWQNKQDWTENNITDIAQQKLSVIVNPKPAIEQSPIPTTVDYGLDRQERTVLRHSSTCQLSSENPVKKAQNRKLTEFKCPHCPSKAFRRRTTLNNHIAVNHTKLRPFICEICQKSYATKCDLSHHQKVHTDQNKCPFCQRTFPVPSKLKRHIRIHTNDRPFVCKNCGKSFSDKRNLDGHQSVHLDVYDFKCDCGRAFKTRNRLKQHMKVHDLDRDEMFCCEICSKSYKYRSNLVLHLKKHNGYFCPYCSKDCERIVKFNKHKKDCLMRK